MPDGARLLERKATSAWDEEDGSRRVLTSSSAKMRALVAKELVQRPPAHLVCTAIYDSAASIIRTLRIDLLEPDTELLVRLEASVSQQILSKGTHRKREIT